MLSSPCTQEMGRHDVVQPGNLDQTRPEKKGPYPTPQTQIKCILWGESLIEGRLAQLALKAEISDTFISPASDHLFVSMQTFWITSDLESWFIYTVDKIGLWNRHIRRIYTTLYLTFIPRMPAVENYARKVLIFCMK